MIMRRAALTTIALVLAGCAMQPPGPRTSEPGRPRASRPLTESIDAATYIAQAGSIDLFVVRASELAQQRSANSRLRNVANALMAGHKGLAAQLSFAGRRLNLLPGAAMLPQHEAMYDELAASGAFDQTYIRQQRAVHGAALSLHTDYARRGSSPTLRPVAANAAAVERNHLGLLRGL